MAGQMCTEHGGAMVQKFGVVWNSARKGQGVVLKVARDLVVGLQQGAKNVQEAR